MRLIDADALIEFIDCGHLRNPLEMCFSERDVIDMIESRPSAQPDLSGYSDRLWKAAYERGKAEAQQRWIPVSDRLPEQNSINLVCGEKGGMAVARFWTDGNLVLWTKTGTGKFVTAIAWMPLPEPYKEESE